MTVQYNITIQMLSVSFSPLGLLKIRGITDWIFLDATLDKIVSYDQVSRNVVTSVH